MAWPGRAATATVLLALALGGSLLWRSGSEPVVPAAQSAGSEHAAAPGPANAAARRTQAVRHGAASAPEPGPLPPSLRGLDVAGGLALSAEGHFVPGPEALELFDFFLSAVGEESLERVRARIEAEIVRRLPAGAAAEARAFLRRYLAYREAARELLTSEPAHSDLERRFQLLRELRRAHFGAALAERLFGEEEALLAVALERRRVARDPSLSPEQRAEALAALDRALPPAERESRRAARAHLELRAAEAELRARGAGPAEIQALREARFGPEAAARLAQLDRRRAEFEARLQAYRAEREALRQREPDPVAFELAVAALRARRFKGPELRRVEALDRLEAAAGRARTHSPSAE